MVVSFTPVRLPDSILQYHLQSLDRQGLDESWFYDDNPHPSPLLARRDCLPPMELPEGEYLREEETHTWTQGAIDRIARIKNAAIARFLDSDHDALFLVDADLLLPHGLVKHLYEAELPVVCSVFFTRWQGFKTLSSPNVWDVHPVKYLEPWQRFRKPGHYRVGGLGACTLIRREVLEAGVNFDPIFGVDYWGEDRWFCVRASVHGFPLFACSHLQPFHVYRDSELKQGVRWLRQR